MKKIVLSNKDYEIIDRLDYLQPRKWKVEASENESEITHTAATYLAEIIGGEENLLVEDLVNTNYDIRLTTNKSNENVDLEYVFDVEAEEVLVPRLDISEELQQLAEDYISAIADRKITVQGKTYGEIYTDEIGFAKGEVEEQDGDYVIRYFLHEDDGDELAGELVIEIEDFETEEVVYKENILSSWDNKEDIRFTCLEVARSNGYKSALLEDDPRVLGREGGKKSMSRLTAEERSELGRKAARARWGKK